MQLQDRIVLLDKPRGTTSFGVVRQLRRLAQVRKAGHCGSLDPLATGLLVLCTGVATRLAALFVDLPKEYHARVRFGRATDSYDADGRTTLEAPVAELDEERVRGALRRFEGEIEQVPPMVSAVKVQGRRLYELARRGEVVERQARRVMVYAIEVVELGAEHVDLRVRCGRGCYVRSIAHELGELMGTPAHLEVLRRVAVGPFRVERATTLDALRAAVEGSEGASAGAGAGTGRLRGVLGLAESLAFLPALHLRAGREAAVRHGMQPDAQWVREAPRAPGTHLLLSEDGARLVGLATAEGRMEVARLRLQLVFPEPVPTSEPEPERGRSEGPEPI